MAVPYVAKSTLGCSVVAFYERYPTMSDAAAPPTATKPLSAVSSVMKRNTGAQWAGSWAEQFPLRAKGRNLVNTRGDRYKLCGINWYGASDALHVVGGLRDQPLADICAAVSYRLFTLPSERGGCSWEYRSFPMCCILPSASRG